MRKTLPERAAMGICITWIILGGVCFVIAFSKFLENGITAPELSPSMWVAFVALLITGFAAVFGMIGFDD